MKKILVSAMLTMVFATAAFGKVVTRRGFTSINVLSQNLNGTELISFQFCKEGGGCRLLGNKRLYTRKELKSRRFNERLEVAYSTAGVGAVAIAGAVVGFFTGGAIYGGVPEIPMIIGAVAGTGAAMNEINAASPMEQLRQQGVISDTVLADRYVEVENEADIEEFKNRLELVLNKIK
jgi:hypothetical protein